MEFHYPNGRKYENLSAAKQKTPDTTAATNYSNRGMTLEEDLNETNRYYLTSGIAVIHKKPTPVQIVHVDYAKRSTAVIKEAYFRQASTTDYNGVCEGKYIDFEAKETKSKTSFPLKNFHSHQIEHMHHVVKQNGIAFVIIRFSTTEEIFLLESKFLFAYWDRMISGGRKSISKKEIVAHGHKIKLGYRPRIDYLKIIREIYAF
ncbi:recombination protein U [Bacillus thermophilus]|uniref:Holliday junction resolvase RecU n=1 Tax=Siminovitchia thermophila TaxID=1245522 RepID=A0ABS2R1T4_9BACI|nr:Holliday junction resolvase RecU [Siminovitchia thermophila]MBM7713602.1 recombination protein U [Siminovitchia thermophila]ONK21929.1 Holliday junction resolvase RecU [Bacillus sp. VT-16-64]